MDQSLRWRLDVIIGLLAFVALSVATLLLMYGGLWGIGLVLVFGLVVSFLLQGLGYAPFHSDYCESLPPWCRSFRVSRRHAPRTMHRT